MEVTPMSGRRFLLLLLGLTVASSALAPGCSCDRQAEQKQDDKAYQQLQQQRQLLLDTLNHVTAGKAKLTDQETAWAQQLWIEIRKIDDQLTQMDRWRPPSGLP
jgi:hypothetical protein